MHPCLGLTRVLRGLLSRLSGSCHASSLCLEVDFPPYLMISAGRGRCASTSVRSSLRPATVCARLGLSTRSRLRPPAAINAPAVALIGQISTRWEPVQVAGTVAIWSRPRGWRCSRQIATDEAAARRFAPTRAGEHPGQDHAHQIAANPHGACGWASRAGAWRSRRAVWACAVIAHRICFPIEHYLRLRRRSHSVTQSVVLY